MADDSRFYVECMLKSGAVHELEGPFSLDEAQRQAREWEGTMDGFTARIVGEREQSTEPFSEPDSALPSGSLAEGYTPNSAASRGLLLGGGVLAAAVALTVLLIVTLGGGGGEGQEGKTVNADVRKTLGSGQRLAIGPSEIAAQRAEPICRRDQDISEVRVFIFIDQGHAKPSGGLAEGAAGFEYVTLLRDTVTVQCASLR